MFSRFFLVLCLTFFFSSYALAQDSDELEFIEFEETISFDSAFIGEIKVGYPSGWNAEADEVSGAIFIGEEVEFSESLGRLNGYPTNIYVVAYPVELEIKDYDEELLFEYYAELFVDALNWTDEIIQETIDLPDRLGYRIQFLSPSQTDEIVLFHYENNVVSVQGSTENHEFELGQMLMSIAASVHIELSETTFANTLTLEAEHNIIMPEGIITFNYPEDWEVRDEPFDTEPVVISNNVDAFLSDRVPPSGVVGIRVSGHATSLNGLLVRQSV